MINEQNDPETEKAIEEAGDKPEATGELAPHDAADAGQKSGGGSEVGPSEQDADDDLAGDDGDDGDDSDDDSDEDDSEDEDEEDGS